MKGFLVRKALYSGWDNMFPIIIVNVATLTVLFGGFFLATLVSAILPLAIVVFAVACLVGGILLSACSIVMAGVADYKPFTFRGYVSAIKSVWLHGLLFSAIVITGIVVAHVAITYYLSLGNPLAFACAILLFWVVILSVLSLQWFLPIRSQLESGFVKCLKKSFLIFFDNPGLSIFMFFYSSALFALSVLLVGFAPGFAGVILAQNEAFRLLMYKYDWLEKHPELDFRAARKAIPWDELIAEDYETIGYRSLKSFIFPWMD